MNAQFDHAPQEKNNQKRSTENAGISMPSTVLVHARLEMTNPGDSDEQEADEMAESVVNEGKIARAVSTGHSGGGIALPSQFGNQLASLQGHGSQLYGDLKNQMESGFGRDFSSVRLHTDDAAAEMSSSISARAFAYNNDIYFNRNQFRPDSTEGQRLVAHELAHIVQGGRKVARDPNTAGSSNSVLIHHDNFEKDKSELAKIMYKKMNDCWNSVKDDYVAYAFSVGRGNDEAFQINMFNKDWSEVKDEILSSFESHNSGLAASVSNNTPLRNKIRPYVKDCLNLVASQRVFDKTLTHIKEHPLTDINDSLPSGVRVHFIFGHGSQYSLTYNGEVYWSSSSKSSKKKTTEDFRDIIVRKYGIKRGDYVFLVSCYTGFINKDEDGNKIGNTDGFAQSLSSIMKDNFIVAPTEPIRYDLSVGRSNDLSDRRPGELSGYYRGSRMSVSDSDYPTISMYHIDYKRIDDFIEIMKLTETISNSTDPHK